MKDALRPEASPDERILALSRQYDLTVYDAAYLELGLRFGCPLLTLDKVLHDAAEKAGLPAWNA